MSLSLSVNYTMAYSLLDCSQLLDVVRIVSVCSHVRIRGCILHLVPDRNYSPGALGLQYNAKRPYTHGLKAYNRSPLWSTNPVNTKATWRPANAQTVSAFPQCKHTLLLLPNIFQFPSKQYEPTCK